MATLLSIACCSTRSTCSINFCNAAIYIHVYYSTETLHYAVPTSTHNCRSCFKEAYSTASKILPTSELYLDPAHPHVVELKNIIAVTKYYM